MSEKEWLHLVKSAAWVFVCATCWIYGRLGYSDQPRFDMWFWGIAFWIDALVFASALMSIG